MFEIEKDFPFKIEISFKKVIEAYQKRAQEETTPIAKKYLEEILSYIKDYPKLVDGIDSKKELEKHKEPIGILLDDLFPNVLTNNEIKAASIPQSNLIFNSSKRFDEILKDAGDDFELSIRNQNQDSNYVYACLLILNHYYEFEIDFTRPLYFDIPDKQGIMKHYRLSVNADFVEFEPSDKAVKISKKDLGRLLQNTNNLDLWREKFPPQSWTFKGFLILNLTDVTVDDGISDLKTQLISNNVPDKENVNYLTEIFRSIYKISDLRVGFSMFNEKEGLFYKMNKGEINSFILDGDDVRDCKKVFCEKSYENLVKEHKYFSIASVEDYALRKENNLLSENLLAKEVKSCILAPMVKNNELLAVLELVSYRKNELNSINAVKLDDIIPYIVTAVERYQSEFENRIKAVIQSECTSIHPSVLWVFEEEAKRYIKDLEVDGVSSFRDIAFKDVYPLYGQIDIVGSSDERNSAIQRDLLKQLKMIIGIIDKAYELEELPIYDQVKFRIREFRKSLKENLNASSEQRIINFIFKEINPLIEHLKNQTPALNKLLKDYESCLDNDSGVIYHHRKNYDDSVQRINRTLARFIDRKQVDAQKIYPHYFERYKTDGVDHNIYIGEEMTRKPFSIVYLYNLRLWQLQIMCEMENKFYHLQEGMPLTLDAASLILVFNSTLSIRYRMDEKKFDVDGTYNARYEIIKKRIDKAYIKNTEERVTQKGKIAIIYSQKADEREYLRYIKYLQSKKYLGENVELVELEDVQGVIGLKAIRVNVLYHAETGDNQQKTFTYEDLMKELH